MGAGSREREDFGEGAHVIQETGGARTGRGGWCVLTRGGSEVDHHDFVVCEGEVRVLDDRATLLEYVFRPVNIEENQLVKNRNLSQLISNLIRQNWSSEHDRTHQC